MRDILIEFRNNINNRGTISQNDILSLEAMIQENVITDKKSINFFTKDSTTIGVQEVSDILDKKINETNVETVMTTRDFLDTSRTIIHNVSKLKEIIYKNIAGLSPEVIDFINNPSYEKIYIKNDETNDNQLVDIKDELLYDLFTTSNTFKVKLYEVINISEEIKEEAELILGKENLTRDTCKYCPLLSELINETIEPFTFRLLLKAKDKISTMEEKLNNLLEYYKEYDSFYKVNKYLSGDKSYVKDIVNEIISHRDGYNIDSNDMIFLTTVLSILNNVKIK